MASAYPELTKSQEEHFRRKFYQKVSKKDYGLLSGRDWKVINQQASLYALPIKGASVNLFEVIRSFHDFIASHGRKIRRKMGEPVDPLGEDNPEAEPTPALERMRMARAQLYEIELEQKRGKLIEREKVHESLGLVSSRLKEAIEQVQKHFGEDAADIMRDALDDAERLVELGFGPVDDALPATNGDSDRETP